MKKYLFQFFSMIFLTFAITIISRGHAQTPVIGVPSSSLPPAQSASFLAGPGMGAGAANPACVATTTCNSQYGFVTLTTATTGVPTTFGTLFTISWSTPLSHKAVCTLFPSDTVSQLAWVNNGPFFEISTNASTTSCTFSGILSNNQTETYGYHIQPLQ